MFHVQADLNRTIRPVRLPEVFALNFLAARTSMAVSARVVRLRSSMLEHVSSMPGRHEALEEGPGDGFAGRNVASLYLQIL